MPRRSRPYFARYQPMARWSLPLAMGRMQRRVEDAKAALADIAAIWGDIDQGTIDEAEGRIRDLDLWMADVERMVRERQEAGEYVGP